jgi:hypothetical protein
LNNNERGEKRAYNADGRAARHYHDENGLTVKREGG